MRLVWLMSLRVLCVPSIVMMFVELIWFRVGICCGCLVMSVKVGCIYNLRCGECSEYCVVYVDFIDFECEVLVAGWVLFVYEWYFDCK